MHVKQADPRASYMRHRQEIEAAIANVLERGTYLNGPEVLAFEEEFADWLAYDRLMYGVAVGSGTAAIEIALRAGGVGKGDEVMTTSLLPSPVGQAILAVGATPVFVDVNRNDFSPRLDQLSYMVNSRTKAIIAVHLYGIPIQTMGQLWAICEDNGILLIEDCSQAHGATLLDRKVGTFGDVAVFSFYPTKNLGALGDAGALVTSDRELASNMRAIQQYGWRGPRISAEYGLNSRMDEIQAAVLRVKLKYLQEETEKRLVISGLYRDMINKSHFILPPRYSGSVYHQFPITCNPMFRDSLMGRLRPHVQTAVHYATPLHLQPAFKKVCVLPDTGLPATEYLSQALISLPMHVGLCLADLRTVQYYLELEMYKMMQEWGRLDG